MNWNPLPNQGEVQGLLGSMFGWAKLKLNEVDLGTTVKVDQILQAGLFMHECLLYLRYCCLCSAQESDRILASLNAQKSRGWLYVLGNHSFPPPDLIFKINSIHLKLHWYFSCHLREFIVADDSNTSSAILKLERTQATMID
jgi:hypothetical protein